uniref:Transcriptional regulatory protein n=1 Tax=Romanomermis culicivorax TaxID=13658 RepID=A0A915IQ46_ROMCU
MRRKFFFKVAIYDITLPYPGVKIMRSTFGKSLFNFFSSRRSLSQRALLDNPNVFIYSSRNKGHSHWQNVLKSKLAGDQMKSQVTGAFCRRIRVLVREGGPDPKINTQLDRMILDALRNNVSKETIQRAIQQAANKPFMNMTFEYKGPGASYIIVDAYSDNRYYVQGQLNFRLKKVPGGYHTNDKTVRSYFEHVGFVRLLKNSLPEKRSDEEKETRKSWNAPPPIEYPPPLSFEDAETLAIEVNANSVNEYTDDEGRPAFEIVCEPDHVRRIEKELTAKHYAVMAAVTEFKPLCRVALSPQHMQYIEQFYAALEDMEEIQGIYDNVLYPEEEN